MIPLPSTDISAGYEIFIKLALLIPAIRDAGLYVCYEFGGAGTT